MKKTILLFTTLLCVILLHAQTSENNNSNPYNLPLSNEEVFQQAELVIEGKFLKIVDSYDTKGSGNWGDIYGITAYYVQKVYKGEQYMEGDTIYVISEGGYLGMENFKYEEIEEGHVISQELFDKGIHNTSFKNPAIYFFAISDYPDDENSKYFQHKKYKFLNKLYYKLYLYENKTVGLNNLAFSNRAELYNYMEQFEGFTVPELDPPENQTEKKPYNKAEIDSLHTSPRK